MPLKIAVPNKGRLSEETVELLRAVGLRVPRASDRTLLSTTGDGRYQILQARAQDIPGFVEAGAADVGVTGLDLVEETGCRVEKLLDLRFGRCKLVVAAPEGSGISSIDDVSSGTRVATPFPNLTRRYFEKRKVRITVVPVSGAAEITPAIGVADLVADLTQTGATLKQNRLSLLDVILDSWAVLVASPAALPRRRQDAEDLAHAIESVEKACGKRYLMANVAKKKLREVVKILPGLRSPTVMDLAAKGMVAVHAVVDEGDVNTIVPRLRKAGATGILVLPIERMVP